jgi:hypothetical protein
MSLGHAIGVWLSWVSWMRDRVLVIVVSEEAELNLAVTCYQSVCITSRLFLKHGELATGKWQAMRRFMYCTIPQASGCCVLKLKFGIFIPLCHAGLLWYH